MKHDGYDVDPSGSSKDRRHYVSAVTREDIIRLMGIGREEGLNQKTINKRLIVTLMALRNAGATIEMKKGDWPKTTDGDVEIYEEDELKAFFGACDADEKLLFQVYLFTGFRNREVATLTWDSVDFKRNAASNRDLISASLRRATKSAVFVFPQRSWLRSSNTRSTVKANWCFRRSHIQSAPTMAEIHQTRITWNCVRK